MRVIFKLLSIGVLFLFVNPVLSQLPTSLIGSHKVISNANVDVLVIQKDRVTGKLDGDDIGGYIFQKKKNGYYYFKRFKKDQLESTDDNRKDERDSTKDDKKNDFENSRRNSDKKLTLNSPNQKKASSDQPDIKVQIIKSENNKTKLIIDYLNNKGEVIKNQNMILQ